MDKNCVFMYKDPERTQATAHKTNISLSDKLTCQLQISKRSTYSEYWQTLLHL